MPRDVLVARPRAEEVKSAADVRDLVPPVLRRFTSPHDAMPRTHLLSNGRYAVMVTAAGSGYSRWGDIAVTRWREDVTRDSWGSYLFLRDMHTGAVWSAGHQPSGAEADSYEVELRGGPRRVLPSRRLDRDRPDHRRVGGARRRDPPRVADQPRLARPRDRADVVRRDRRSRRRRPTSPTRPSRTCSCRPSSSPRSAPCWRPAARGPRDEQPIWAAHVAAVEEETGGVIQYETDRARFLGRGRSVRSPVSVIDGRPLSNTVGAVLDPIFSLRCRVQPRTRARPPTRSSRRSSPSRARTSWTWPTSTASRPPSSGRRPWPGRRPRSSSITSGSRPTRPTSSSAWPTGSSTRTRRCGRRRACWPATSAERPACGPTASRATCRSSWCGSTRPRTSTSSASCSARTSTGA